MHEIREPWALPPVWAECALQGAGVSIRPLLNLRQIVISGAIEAGMQDLAPGAPLRGPLDLDGSDPYAIRLAPHRALVVGSTAVEMPGGRGGWNDKGYAASDASDVFVVFEIEGEGAQTIWACGSNIDLTAQKPPSGGAAGTMFAEIWVAAYLQGTGDCVRIHVERSLAPYLWRWFETIFERRPAQTTINSNR